MLLSNKSLFHFPLMILFKGSLEKQRHFVTFCNTISEKLKTEMKSQISALLLGDTESLFKTQDERLRETKVV